jgi:hypothetical protein
MQSLEQRLEKMEELLHSTATHQQHHEVDLVAMNPLLEARPEYTVTPVPSYPESARQKQVQAPASIDELAHRLANFQSDAVLVHNHTLAHMAPEIASIAAMSSVPGPSGSTPAIASISGPPIPGFSIDEWEPQLPVLRTHDYHRVTGDFRSSMLNPYTTLRFSPLVHPSMAQSLLASSVPEIMPPPFGVFTLPEIWDLFQEQFSERPDGPYALDDESPGPAYITMGETTGPVATQTEEAKREKIYRVARWVAVNAVLAASMRFKMAHGAENLMSGIIRAFYRNATVCLSDLLLGTPSFMSIQAFLVMSVFARGSTPRDSSGMAMMVGNAVRMMEILTGSLTGMTTLDVQKEGAERLARVLGAMGALVRDVS